jgi:hypothetical protein
LVGLGEGRVSMAIGGLMGDWVSMTNCTNRR